MQKVHDLLKKVEVCSVQSATNQGAKVARTSTATMTIAARAKMYGKVSSSAAVLTEANDAHRVLGGLFKASVTPGERITCGQLLGSLPSLGARTSCIGSWPVTEWKAFVEEVCGRNEPQPGETGEDVKLWDLLSNAFHVHKDRRDEHKAQEKAQNEAKNKSSATALELEELAFGSGGSGAAVTGAGPSGSGGSGSAPPSSVAEKEDPPSGAGPSGAVVPATTQINAPQKRRATAARAMSQPAPTPLVRKPRAPKEIFYAERLLGHREVKTGEKVVLQYLVKWRDYGDESNTWEPRSNLLTCGELIREYKEANGLPVDPSDLAVSQS